MVMKRRQKLKSRAAALSGVSPVSKTAGASGVRKSRTRKESVRKERKRDLIERETALSHKKKKKSTNKTKAKVPGLKLNKLAMDGLHTALMEAVEADGNDATATNNNNNNINRKKGGVNIASRKHRVREESAQLSSVLENAAFKDDPVAALREHLLNTVCANPLEVPAKPDEGKAVEVEKAKNNNMKLEIKREELDKIKEGARERIRAKRERKEAMAVAAQAFQQKERRQQRGVDKIRVSPHRGRIGVKRPKLLDDINININDNDNTKMDT